MAGTTKLMTAGGGGVSLTPASSIASDVTVNVPSSNGTLVSTGETAQVSQAMLASGVAGNGPAFSAYQSASAQSISATTWTKLTFDAEEYDTNNNFSSSRFTPTVAGYYFVTSAWIPNSSASTTIEICKNGSAYKTGVFVATGAIGGALASVNALVYCNGSTDYIEAFAYSSVSNTASNNAASTFFQGFLARAA